VVIASGVTGPGYLNIRKGPWHPIRIDCQDASGAAGLVGRCVLQKARGQSQTAVPKNLAVPFEIAAWSIEETNTLRRPQCQAALSSQDVQQTIWLPRFVHLVTHAKTRHRSIIGPLYGFDAQSV
jgi:hypothetical protein